MRIEATRDYVPGWCPYCGEPEQVCKGTCGLSDEDHEDAVCIHGVPMYDACDYCDQDEDGLW